MKKRVKSSLVLFLAVVCMIPGCGKKDTEKLVIEKIQSQMESDKENIVNQTESIGDLKITLSQIVFEKENIILDYRMEAENLSEYQDVVPEVIKDNKVIGSEGNSYTSERSKGQQYIMFQKTDDVELTEKNIGEEVEIHFKSYSRADIDIVFSVKIQKVYQPKIVPINKELSYGAGSVGIQSLEVSKFYTTIHVENVGYEFMEQFYSFEICNQENEKLQFLGGSSDRYDFTYLEDWEKVKIKVIQYTNDTSYKDVSEVIEILKK